VQTFVVNYAIMKKILLLKLLLLSFMLSNAQSQISGKVTGTDEEPLPGVNVVIKGTTQGTVTDIGGNFTIEATSNDVLIFSFIGFITEEVKVGTQSFIDILMSEDVTSLQEVVVIGYGTTTERELTGSVSTVSEKQIAALNPTRLEQALQGQSSGVQISSASGSPGGAFNIRIRGITTNGDNRPLIVVDGVIYENLDAINPNTIQSINILKDATTAIYGVRGANGVILITTKDGSGVSKPTLTFDSYYGIQETARKIPVLNASEYAVLINESFANNGQTPPFANTALGEGTDWQDEVFERAPVQSHQLSYRGNDKKSTYAFGAGYFTQDGIVGGDKSSFDRITANINNTRELIPDLKIETILNYSNIKRQTLLENTLGSVLFNALNMAPTLTPRDSDGEFTLADGLGSEVINPLAQIQNSYNETNQNRVFGRVGLSYEVIKGLIASSSFNFNYTNQRFKSFTPIVDYGIGKVFNQVESSVTENQEIFYDFNIDNVINYKKQFDVHSISATIGSSIVKNRSENLSATGFGIPNNSFEFADISSATERRENDFSSFQGEARLTSIFGRVEYSYNQRYLFSGLLRRDGSTRFGPENKFGVFYAISGGWIISEEDFLKGIDAIDFLKLRASYGETGNDKIGDFGFVSVLDGEAEYVFDGNTITSGQANGQLSNPDIEWERNEQLNIGLDAEMFDSKVTLGIDYFIKKTNGLLIEVPTSGLTGSSAPGSANPIANAGSIENKGLEIQLGYQNTIFKDFYLQTSINLTALDNNTTSLAGGDPIPGGGFGIGQLPPTLWQVGQPIGAYYGLQTNGIFQNQTELAGSAQEGIASVGDLRYVDQDGDGNIDSDDRTFIGSPIPDLTVGFNLNLTYKNFDFSALAEGQFGYEIVRNYERNLPFTNKTGYYLERWTGDGSSSSFPRLSVGANDNDQFSDFWIEDGSYVRIKNLQLGYTLPKELISKLKMSRLRIYASVSNLYTFTDYQGYDPNISVVFDPDNSPQPALGSTIDNGYYPQARTYIFGLNLTF
jgi:TonB-dependent starch-binding outer membrane protein SusC